MRVLVFAAALLLPPLHAHAAGAITVRTENYPRPPYSGATYYIYGRDGQTICTKLEVCNKFEQCDTRYEQGAYKDPEDVETGQPYGTTPAVTIAPASLAKHVCLTRFGLAGGR
ncbi:hypothetical protein [Methylobacterium oryzihabitans]|uniref:Uncharacterized protein n=1 Tax=Methylobacterium oryzihabitans TaxID=2499852 RepID=A0A3S2XGG3_9HYPH|nr:hypothetical protein [Methylobacterium oryzihabitans]RVU14147.1 hypothetical protein EOE48_24670 [Methylobacterium oryzihabitans]